MLLLFRLYQKRHACSIRYLCFDISALILVFFSAFFFTHMYTFPVQTVLLHLLGQSVMMVVASFLRITLKISWQNGVNGHGAVLVK